MLKVLFKIIINSIDAKINRKFKGVLEESSKNIWETEKSKALQEFGFRILVRWLGPIPSPWWKKRIDSLDFFYVVCYLTLVPSLHLFFDIALVAAKILIRNCLISFWVNPLKFAKNYQSFSSKEKDWVKLHVSLACLVISIAVRLLDEQSVWEDVKEFIQFIKDLFC